MKITNVSIPNNNNNKSPIPNNNNYYMDNNINDNINVNINNISCIYNDYQINKNNIFSDKSPLIVNNNNQYLYYSDKRQNKAFYPNTNNNNNYSGIYNYIEASPISSFKYSSSPQRSPGGKVELKINQFNSLNKKHISQLENIVYNLLQLSLNYGDTYIITNASKNWVLYSSMIYFPKIIQLFNKIKIISARDAYEKNFPNNNKFWKLAVFMDITNLYNKNLITNIISIGDSLIENEAAFKLSSIFSECYIKTIKIQEESKPELLLKQLKLILKQFNFFHSSVRNISVKIEKNNIKL
jgi:hypothetical protein